MGELLRAALKTGGGSVGFLLLGMLATKIMAVVLGPSGVGLYSLLRQTVDLCKGIGTVGGEAALVQGLASRKGEEQDSYLVTTFWAFALGCSLIVAGLLAFAPWIALWVFDRNDGQTVNMVRGLALPAALWVASTYINGVLNGFRAIGLLALFQVLGTGAMALLAYPVSRLVEVGYPIAFIVVLSAPPAVSVVLGVWSALQAGWLSPLVRSVGIRLDPASLRHFSSFAGTTFVTGLVATGTVLAVRSLIIRYDGLAGAGVFAAAWTLSMAYIMLALASFGTYYMPTLSQTDEPLDRTTLMQQVMRLATLTTVPLIVGVVVLKPLAVQILYSGEFTSSLEIIRWMLIGDYFKVAAWVVAVPALAFADMKVYFWTELLWHAGFLACAALALSGFDSTQGIGIGFLLMYVLYLAYYLHYARSRHRFSLRGSVVRSWVLGLALVVGASWYTWSDTQVNWLTATLWVVAAVGFSWLSLDREERERVLHMFRRRKEAGNG
jgi:O-antigen/teichoic acid export membrane protein